MGNETDFAGRRANARRIDDAAWELIAEKLEKDVLLAESHLNGLGQQGAELGGAADGRPASARDEEDAARVGSKPSARTAPSLRGVRARNSSAASTEQQPSPAGKEPLPGVV
jgi:hypothetical protein